MAFIITAKMVVLPPSAANMAAVNAAMRGGVAGMGGAAAAGGAAAGAGVAAGAAAGARATNRLGVATTNLGGSLKNTSRFLSTTVRDIATLTGGMLTLHGVILGVIAGLKSFVEYEKQLGAMAQITRRTISEVSELGTQVRQLGIEYGVNTSILQKNAIELLQAGRSIGQVRQALPVLALLGTNAQVGADGLAEATKAWIVWQNVFKQSDAEVEQSFQKVVKLAKQQFITVSELIEGTTILANTAKSSGASFEEMISIIAATKTRAGRPVTEVSRALNTLLSRVISPQRAKQLKEQFGLEVFEGGKIKGPIALLTEIKRVRDSFGEASRAGAELEIILGGLRRRSLGGAALSSIEDAARNLESISGNIDELDADFARVEKTIGVQLGQTIATMKDAFISLVEDGSMRTVLESVLGMVRGLTVLSGVAKTLLPIMIGLGGVRFARFIAPAIGATVFGTAARHPRGSNVIGGRIPARQGLAQGRVSPGAAGAIAVGAGLLAGQLGTQDEGSRRLKAGLEGITVGFGLLLFSVNPLIAATAGLTATFIRLAQFTEEERKASKLRRVQESGEGLQLTLRGLRGELTDITAPVLANTVKGVGDQIKKELEQSKTERVESIGNLTKPGPGGIPGFSGKLLERETERLNKKFDEEEESIRRKGADSSLQAITQLRDLIIGLPEVRTMEDFKNAFGGTGKILLAFIGVLGSWGKALTDGTAKLLEQKAANIGVAQSAAEVVVILAAKFGKMTQEIKNTTSIISDVVDRASSRGGFSGPAQVLSSFGQRGNAGAIAGAPISANIRNALLEIEASAQAMTKVVQKAPVDMDITELVGELVAAATPEMGDELRRRFEELNLEDNRAVPKFAAELRDIGTLVDSLAEEIAPGFREATKEAINGMQRGSREFASRFGEAINQFLNVIEAQVSASRAVLEASNLETQIRTGRAARGGGFNRLALQQAGTLAGTVDIAAISKTIREAQAGLSIDAGVLDTARLESVVTRNVAALNVLADATTRLTGIQDDLARAQEGLRSKFDLAEEFIGGDQDTRRQMIRDAMAAQTAIQRGTFAGLTDEIVQGALRHLGRVGTIEGAAGLSPRGFTGEELKQSLIRSTIGGQFFAPELGTQRQAEEQTIQIMREAAMAQQALAIAEEGMFNKFISDLGMKFDQFLDGLAQGRAGLLPGIGGDLSLPQNIQQAQQRQQEIDKAKAFANQQLGQLQFPRIQQGQPEPRPGARIVPNIPQEIPDLPKSQIINGIRRRAKPEPVFRGFSGAPIDFGPPRPPEQIAPVEPPFQSYEEGRPLPNQLNQGGVRPLIEGQALQQGGVDQAQDIRRVGQAPGGGFFGGPMQAQGFMQNIGGGLGVVGQPQLGGAQAAVRQPQLGGVQAAGPPILPMVGGVGPGNILDFPGITQQSATGASGTKLNRFGQPTLSREEILQRRRAEFDIGRTQRGSQQAFRQFARKQIDENQGDITQQAILQNFNKIQASEQDFTQFNRLRQQGFTDVDAVGRVTFNRMNKVGEERGIDRDPTVKEFNNSLKEAIVNLRNMGITFEKDSGTLIKELTNRFRQLNPQGQQPQQQMPPALNVQPAENIQVNLQAAMNESFNQFLQNFTQALTNFGESADDINNAGNEFKDAAGNLAAALTNNQLNIDMKQTVDVNIDGSEAFADAEENFRNIAEQTAQQVVSNLGSKLGIPLV